MISDPTGYEPSANKLLPSCSTPNLALKQRPPSATGFDVSYNRGVPGCFISAVPQQGQGRP